MKQFFRETKPFGQLLALLLIFVLFFIISTGISVLAILLGIPYDDIYFQASLSQVVAFATTALVFAWLFYDRPASVLQLRVPDRFSSKILGAVLMLICLIPLSDWLTQVNDGWHLPASMSALEEAMRNMSERTQMMLEDNLLRNDLGSLLLNLLVIALLPALCEELLFRGALQTTLCRCFRNHHVAIWVTAAVFSLFHGEIFAFLPRFMLGAALGYLFYYGGSLWCSGLFHFLNNACAVIIYYEVSKGNLDYAMVDSFNSPWYLALAGAVIGIFVFVVFYARHYRRVGDESEEIERV